MQRRTYLRRAAATVAVGVSGLAGCTSGPGDPQSPKPTTVTDEPTDSGPHPVTPTDTSFVVRARSCGAGTNTATVSVDGDTIRVNGVIGGSDTCDTAQLKSVDLDNGKLRVVVETVKEETTATPACGQCLTDIEYAFETTIPDSQPSEVEVAHHAAMADKVITRVRVGN